MAEGEANIKMFLHSWLGERERGGDDLSDWCIVRH